MNERLCHPTPMHILSLRGSRRWRAPTSTNDDRFVNATGVRDYPAPSQVMQHRCYVLYVQHNFTESSRASDKWLGPLLHHCIGRNWGARSLGHALLVLKLV
jgi:hypothetical protein